MPKPNFPSLRKYKVKNLIEDFPSLLKIILNLNFNVKGFTKFFQMAFALRKIFPINIAVLLVSALLIFLLEITLWVFLDLPRNF